MTNLREPKNSVSKTGIEKVIHILVLIATFLKKIDRQIVKIIDKDLKNLSPTDKITKKKIINFFLSNPT